MVVVTKQTQILAQPAADLQDPSTGDVVAPLEIQELLEYVNAIPRVALEEIDVVVHRAGLRPSGLPPFAVAEEVRCVHLRLGHDRIVGRGALAVVERLQDDAADVADEPERRQPP
jgi:hypothetical protein